MPLSLSESVDQLSPRGFSQSRVYRKLLVRVSEIVQDRYSVCSRGLRQILLAATCGHVNQRTGPICCRGVAHRGRFAGKSQFGQRDLPNSVLSGRKDSFDNHPDDNRCLVTTARPMREYSTVDSSMAAFDRQLAHQFQEN